MPLEKVQCTGQIPVSAERVWSLVRDFHGTWHPAINSMTAELDDFDGSIRAFTVHGDDNTYRERLTWFSDSEQSMAYTHIEGIAGVQSYDARLSVSSSSADSCTVTLSAQLTAPSPRASQIADGTKVIFDEAIAAIEKALMKTPDQPDQFQSGRLQSGEPSIRAINGSPSLSVSHIDCPDKETLCLFLHGIGGNKGNWLSQLRAVSPFCSVAALDLRGYGSSALGDNQSTVEDYCEDILRVADQFNVRKMILCGLSYGAWIATSFAVRYPERLAGLVLSGGCTGMSEASNEEREAFRLSREVPMSEGKTPADFAPDVVSVLAGPECSEIIKQELLSSMQSIPSQTYADALRCFTNPTEQFVFSSIKCPVLLMTGDSDRLAPPIEIRKVAERIHRSAPNPDVRYECLSSAGHVCNLEAPEAYNDALVSLVQRLVQ